MGMVCGWEGGMKSCFSLSFLIKPPGHLPRAPDHGTTTTLRAPHAPLRGHGHRGQSVRGPAGAKPRQRRGGGGRRGGGEGEGVGTKYGLSLKNEGEIRREEPKRGGGSGGPLSCHFTRAPPAGATACGPPHFAPGRDSPGCWAHATFRITWLRGWRWSLAIACSAAAFSWKEMKA